MNPDLSKLFPNASASFLKLHGLGNGPISPALAANLTKETSPTPKPAQSPQKGRLRQNTAGLNKLEQAFQDWMALSPMDNMLTQSITLKIANGCRYTPDFITITDEPLEDAAGYAQTLKAYEVKGFMRDDAAVKLKVAAFLYPWIKFHLVTRKKGQWIVQEILP